MERKKNTAGTRPLCLHFSTAPTPATFIWPQTKNLHKTKSIRPDLTKRVTLCNTHTYRMRSPLPVVGELQPLLIATLIRLLTLVVLDLCKTPHRLLASC